MLLKLGMLQNKFDEAALANEISPSIFNWVKLKFYSWRLNNCSDKPKIEKGIRENQNRLVEYSRVYLKSFFLKRAKQSEARFSEVKSFLKEVEDLKFNDELQVSSFPSVLEVLPLWSCTLKSLNRSFPLVKGIFDYVIFDEASQVDLPSAAPALYRSKRVVVVGDAMQLTHIAKVNKAQDQEIAEKHELYSRDDVYPTRIRYSDVSLFRSAEACSREAPILLASHYRSEDQIITLCNEAFYGGQLKVCTNLDQSRWVPDLQPGLFWEDVQGEVAKPPVGSRLNKAEASKVCEILLEVLRKIKGSDLTIGIVTPYSAQQREIYRKVTGSVSDELMKRHDIKILTAHKFQGSEKDIMIFSLVLSGKGQGSSERWYDMYPQILNVAMSRAKFLLYVVGDLPFCLKSSGVLGKLSSTYKRIKEKEELDRHVFANNFDSKAESELFRRLQTIDFESLGYKLVPKLVFKRYTLDFALVGEKKINIECDGLQHKLIGGLPVIEDLDRDEFLHTEGWTVLRVPNHRVYTELDEVVAEIQCVL